MYAAATEVIATDLGTELILLDPRSGKMFGLSGAGRTVWLALPALSNNIVDALLTEFDVAPEVANADVRDLLAALREANLISCDEDAT